MQGLADGYFVLPYTIGDYLARQKAGFDDTQHAAFGDVQREVLGKVERLLAVKGNKSADTFHRRVGLLMWEKCGMARNKQGLEEALAEIPTIREEFWSQVSVPGTHSDLNQALETAGRVSDFIDFSEIMVRDALTRSESCGAHFREESQTPEGEALRDDENFQHGAVWEFNGEGNAPTRHQEPLTFNYVPPSQRSYK
jgi:succinate dehydrogenase / fumarate reductase flavoprotein subunit